MLSQRQVIHGVVSLWGNGGLWVSSDTHILYHSLKLTVSVAPGCCY